MKQYDRTREIISQLSSKGKASISLSGSKHILVIFTGTMTMEDGLKPLVRGRGQGVRYDLVFSKAAEEMMEIDKIALKFQPRKVMKESIPLTTTNLLKDIDGIVVPFLTQNTAFKLALGIQDQLIPRLLWHGLWIGKPIWMNLEGLLTYMDNKTASIALNKMIEDNIQKLKGMGIKEMSGQDYMLDILEALNLEVRSNNLHKTEGGYLDTILQAEKKEVRHEGRIITEGDILKFSSEVKEIKLNSNSIITPLAYDTAKRRGINIIKAQTPI